MGTITDYKHIFLPLLTDLTSCSNFLNFPLVTFQNYDSGAAVESRTLVSYTRLLTIISSAIDEFVGLENNVRKLNGLLIHGKLCVTDDRGSDQSQHSVEHFITNGTY